MTGYIIVGEGKPWRIPGTAPSSPLPVAELLNSCGDPGCKGSSDHAPDQEYVFTTPPAPLPSALTVKGAGGH